MNILMLLNAPYPDDIRVSKEAKSLAEAGHTVFILCTKKSPKEASVEKLPFATVIRCNPGNSLYMQAFWDVVMSVRFIHPIFYRAAKKAIKEYSIAAVHVHDLPLAGTGIKLAKKFGLRSIVDLHENYPEAIKVWFQWKKNPIARLKNYLFLNYQRWIAWEAKACREADVIIAVVEEMKERLVNMHPLSSDKIKIISNTENKDFLNQPVFSDIYGNTEGRFIVAYTGNVGPHRGVDTLVEAFQYLKDFPKIELHISGSTTQTVKEKLLDIVHLHGLEQQVFLKGHQPFSHFYSLMKMADVNVIPHHRNGHTDNTIPHKLFQAMMTGKPLLVSSSPPLARTVTEYHSGLVFEASNAKSLAEAIQQLYNSPELAASLGSNGLKATQEKGANWETSALDLVKIYA
ncbi:glycosyltransferase family 4 protein [Cytophagales bacterium LB-30]|uniref:Glycosyltransferase family 4 protein n=1 Tax=Shiella aurantiaca TaxID=3058365 RepID=A0ABT8F389_9BACT|nr:glycosyltransferase family 4 protein [Shiella aurantiaca]MDN4164920.1 glycosyltransferase family 4 protein [Shiella aurantiaca]